MAERILQKTETIPEQVPFPDPLGPEEPKPQVSPEQLPLPETDNKKDPKSIFTTEEVERILSRDREQPWWWN